MISDHHVLEAFAGVLLLTTHAMAVVAGFIGGMRRTERRHRTPRLGIFGVEKL